MSSQIGGSATSSSSSSGSVPSTIVTAVPKENESQKSRFIWPSDLSEIGLTTPEVHVIEAAIKLVRKSLSSPTVWNTVKRGGTFSLSSGGSVSLPRTLTVYT